MSDGTMIVGIVVVAVLAATVIAEMVVQLFEIAERDFDRPKPWWIAPLKRITTLLLVAIPGFFFFMLFRLWWRHGGP